MRSIVFGSLLLLACTPQVDVLKAREIPTGVAADVEVFASAERAFAGEFYAHAVTGSNENRIVSPFSVAMELSMLQAGAAGETALQIRNAIGASLTPDRLNVTAGAVLQSLAIGRGYGAYSIADANSLFYQQGLALEQNFSNTITSDYQSPPTGADFQNDPSGAVSAINDLISHDTESAIPTLFEDGDISSSTRVVFANAIAFQGQWSQGFETAAGMPFHREDGSTVSVPTMTLVPAFSLPPPVTIAALPTGKLVSFPFKGKDITMYVMLPASAGELAAVEAMLDADTMDDWINQPRSELPENTNVTLPRFSITYRADLVANLGALGVVDAFLPTADFSGIDGAHDLSLQNAAHVSAITVDEEGAKAAGATGASGGVISEPVPFNIDHAFLFVIYDEVTRSVLFIGHVMDPS